MQYYDNNIEQNLPKLTNYFKQGILSNDKNIGHCLLFWGPDIATQYSLALEVARLLNCKENADFACECLNCKWIKEDSHPAVKRYTRLDFKELSKDDSKGTKIITIEQARAIISEVSITSDYHRVYIFCDRDKDGNLLPLNKINFPEATANALLKTFEETPSNTTFILLTNSCDDLLSTIVSRSQTFFVPKVVENNYDYSFVESIVSNYWTIEKTKTFDFLDKLYQVSNEYEIGVLLSQIQNYIYSVLCENIEDKILSQKLLRDMKFVEEAKLKVSLNPSMSTVTVLENLAYQLIL